MMTFERSVRSASSGWLLTVIMCLASPAVASEAADQEKVVEAMRLMYVAATNDDLTRFRAVTTPDFYTFDGGKRMTCDQLMALIKKAHDAGRIYVWEVTEPQAYVEGNMAWLTYVNRGSVQDAAGRKDVIWLESAVLRKDDGAWRIRFFHSTRVPAE